MKRVFISQPMNGMTKREIIMFRNNAQEDIETIFAGEDIVYVNPLQNGMEYDGITRLNNPLKWLGKSIKKLADADVAYFCYGWKDARGCRIEHQCAKEYGIEIIEKNNLF